MYFLLTRPEQDCHKLAQELIVLRHQVACAPMLTIRYHDQDPVELACFQAIIFTSANGVRALARNSRNRDIDCFVVGAATAQAAQANGFQHVFTAGGNVDSVAELIMEKLEPKAGPLLHISGRDIAGNLSAVLGQAGFLLTRKRLYVAEQATRLPPQIPPLITSGRISHIPLYSPRSAKIFAELITSAHLDNCLSPITVLCLSPAVANVIDCLHWREILTASHPDQTSLFELVKITFKEDRQ